MYCDFEIPRSNSPKTQNNRFPFITVPNLHDMQSSAESLYPSAHIVAFKRTTEQEYTSPVTSYVFDAESLYPGVHVTFKQPVEEQFVQESPSETIFVPSQFTSDDFVLPSDINIIFEPLPNANGIFESTQKRSSKRSSKRLKKMPSRYCD